MRKKEIIFATSVLSESTNLQFDSEGRVSLTPKLLKHARIKNSMIFVGQGKPFKFGSQLPLKNLRSMQEKKQILIVQVLNGSINLTNNGG